MECVPEVFSLCAYKFFWSRERKWNQREGVIHLVVHKFLKTVSGSGDNPAPQPHRCQEILKLSSTCCLPQESRPDSGSSSFLFPVTPSLTGYEVWVLGRFWSIDWLRNKSDKLKTLLSPKSLKVFCPWGKLLKFYSFTVCNLKKYIPIYLHTFTKVCKKETNSQKRKQLTLTAQNDLVNDRLFLPSVLFSNRRELCISQHISLDFMWRI